MTIRPVKVITASDLEENGGVYLVQKGVPAVPVWGFTEQGNQAVSSSALPVYVVTEAEFNAGDFVKGRGQPMRVGDIDDLEFVGALEGRTAVPVWAVNDWPTSVPVVPQTYNQKVLSYNPVYYWPLNEISGTVAVNAVNPGTADGTYSASDIAGQSTFLDGTPAPLFVPADNNLVTLPHASLSLFNGSVGWLMQWIKVRAASVWSDGVLRFGIKIQTDAANRYIETRKRTSVGAFDISYRADLIESFIYGSLTSTDWIQFALTWDSGADEVRGYLNGVPTISTGLGVWTGSLNLALIGSDGSGVRNWDGYLTHIAIGAGSVLSDAEVADLASPLS